VQTPVWRGSANSIIPNPGSCLLPNKKLNLFLWWVPVGGGGHKERGKEGVYGGCVLYTCNIRK
jgi:hypothetical protein